MATVKNRDLTIDILRCGAVLYIVAFWHIREYSNALSSFCKTKTTQYLAFCVLGLFVYLSGFLLSQKYRFEKPGDIMNFYRHRFFRIYPLYLIALTLFLALGYVNFRGYLEAALLSNMFTGHPLTTLWFVTMILVFYAITPLFLKPYKPARIIIYTLAAYVGLLALHAASGLIHLRLPLYLPIFAAGIMIARSEKAQKAIQNNVVVAISFLCSVLLSWIFSQVKNDILLVIVLSPASLAAIPVFLTIAKTLSPFLNKRFVFIISYSSFSLYLMHRITFGLGTLLYQPRTVLSAILYLACVLLPITIAIAYGFQIFYDKFCDFNRPLSVSHDQ